MRIISGDYKGLSLKQPPLAVTRPTTDKIKQSIFNILEHKFDCVFADMVILDAFSGSGAMGIEALSRGAKKAYLVEKSGIAFSVLNQNIATLKSVSCHAIILKADVFNTRFHDVFDLVFLDPPYAQNHFYEKLVVSLKSQNALHKETLFVAEMPKTHTLNFACCIKDERIFSNIKVCFFTVE
ncbi:MAG: Ribosomal RNA small subunit methyltransferase D [Holosporales bacterium]